MDNQPVTRDELMAAWAAARDLAEDAYDAMRDASRKETAARNAFNAARKDEQAAWARLESYRSVAGLDH